MREREIPKPDEHWLDRFTSIDNSLAQIRDLLSGGTIKEETEESVDGRGPINVNVTNIGDLFHLLPLLDGWEWRIVENEGVSVPADKNCGVVYCKSTSGWFYTFYILSDDKETHVQLVIDSRTVLDTTIQSQNDLGFDERGVVLPWTPRYNPNTDDYGVALVFDEPWPFRDNVQISFAPSQDATATYGSAVALITNKHKFLESISEIGLQ